MLDLEIPRIMDKIGDHERNTVFLQASISAVSVSGEKKKNYLGSRAGDNNL